MARLDGKVAIVTGAASGIGKATVELFRSEGATVVGADIAEGADVQCDAGNGVQMKRLIDGVAAEHGGLDIVFANAGVSGGFRTIAEQTADDWAEILRINLIGPFIAIKHSARHLQARGGGSIICTASTAGLRSGAGGAAYSASKAGVINLVKTAAQQVAGHNIRVNAVAPGMVETGMTKHVYDMARELGKSIGGLTPLDRDGSAEEIAKAVLFLASDDSSYVNGTVLVVDGGLASSHPTTRRFNLRML